MFQKKCVICGRAIKTGRKYCWEHRHSSEADGLSSMDKLEKEYRKYRQKQAFPIKYLILILFLLGTFFAAYPSINKNVNSFLFSIGTFIIAALVLICIITDVIVRQIYRKKAEKEIMNRSPKFVEYAKLYGDVVKEERKFKSSIFR